jgi:imidazolonepropionase-like amidohydrolase
MRIFKFLITSLYLIGSFNLTQAQTGLNSNDVANPKPLTYAFTHVNIYIDYQTVVYNATLVIADGKVAAVGANITIPKGATIIDLESKYIYPSFIDIYTSYGMPELPKNPSSGNVYNSTKKGPYNWNEAVRPETQAAELFSYHEKEATALRNIGFGAVVSHNPDGLVRGSGALIGLGNGRPNKLIWKSSVSQHFSFNRGSSSQDYPRSLMGCIALLRQTLYDQQWYEKAKTKELDLSLDALIHDQALPKFFEASDKWNVLRADKIAKEFNTHFIIKGGGDEYQRLDAIKATGASFILPIQFPYAIETDDSFLAPNIPLKNLMHWEQAPSNPYKMWQAGIPFALTTHGLGDKKDFWKNLQKVWVRGLSTSELLKSLTYTPAKYIHEEQLLGNLRAGSLANFFIADDTLFGPEFMISETWIKGEKYINSEKPKIDQYQLNGKYKIKNNTDYFVYISGYPSKPQADLKDKKGKQVAKAEIANNGNRITFKAQGLYEESWTVDTDFVSKTIIVKGTKMRELKPSDTQADSAKKPLTQEPLLVAKLYKPFIEYGLEKSLENEAFIISNGTIWTNEKEGIMQRGDVVVKNGKIAEVGSNLSSKYSGLKTIDGSGLHITAGIIDEHSHIAATGDVNEGTQSVTSEVRIADIINPEDINIYRQLSGGVTTSHILHGSANSIGGQTQLIKLRWGKTAEEMKFEGWDGFIKFALGENVKQSNWGDRNVSRYPQTRMGVEQTMMDAFVRAKAYREKWNIYKLNKLAEAPRRDLELDALVEILENRRHITCHSYVQSEINMLMHLADSMGFHVNTFTHILEGYKVADKMKKHGAAGSTFADWWAYKHEVMEAIPYNAYLMDKIGIVTCVNSDDAEMARRLNQEAAKSMKYGGMSDTSAFKLCTLNPAKMLHIDQRVGSIKAGKDADVVIWNGNPLSIYSKVLKTYVDGICYYDLAQQENIQLQMVRERNRIISKMKEARKNGDKTGVPEISHEEEYGCGH